MPIICGVTSGLVTGQSRTTLKVLEILSAQEQETVVHIAQPHKLSVLELLRYYLNVFYYAAKDQHTPIYLSFSRSLKSFYVRDLLILLIVIVRKNPCVLHLVGNDFESLLNRSRLAFLLYRIILLRPNNSIIVLSKRMETQVMGLLKFTRTQFRSFILPGFIDIDIDYSKISSLKGPQQKGHFSIGFMSNLIPEKGLEDFLDAINLLLEKDKPYKLRFWIAGKKIPGNDYSKLDAMIKKGLVNYQSFIDGTQKSTILYKTDLFVLPTYYPTEALPLSLVEAAAHGSAIISCNTGDIDTVVNLTNGTLVKPNNPQEISHCIEDFVSRNDFDHVKVSQTVCDHFSTEKYQNLLHNIFNLEQFE